MDSKLKELASNLLENDKDEYSGNFAIFKNEFIKVANKLETENFFDLWRMFYTILYHADTKHLQRLISVNFCILIRHLEIKQVADWMDAFWFILSEGWHNLDRYRLEKMSVLIRIFVFESLNWLKVNNWCDEAIHAVVSSWELTPFKLEHMNHAVPLGIALQILNVFMEELINDFKDIDTASFCKLIKLFETRICNSRDRFMKKTIMEKVYKKVQDLPNVDVKCVAESLFYQALRSDQKQNLDSVYQSIAHLDKILEARNTSANYEKLVKEYQDTKEPEPATSLNTDEMLRVSKKLKKEEKLRKKRKREILKMKLSKRKLKQGSRRKKVRH